MEEEERVMAKNKFIITHLEKIRESDAILVATFLKMM
jgi:hypothetical protein